MEPVPDRELLEFQRALFRHQAWHACFNSVLSALIIAGSRDGGFVDADMAVQIAQNYATAIHGHVPDMP